MAKCLNFSLVFYYTGLSLRLEDGYVGFMIAEILL